MVEAAAEQGERLEQVPLGRQRPGRIQVALQPGQRQVVRRDGPCPQRVEQIPDFRALDEAGTRARVQSTPQGILLQPVTRTYIRSLRGSLKGRGVMKALREDRAHEREL